MVDTIITPNSPPKATAEETANLMAFNPDSSYTPNAAVAEADVASSLLLDGASEKTIAIDMAPSEAINDIPSLDISRTSDNFTAELVADGTVVQDEKDVVVPPNTAAARNSISSEDAMMLDNAMRQVSTTIPTVVSGDDSAAVIDAITVVHPVAVLKDIVDRPQSKVANNAASHQAPASSGSPIIDINSDQNSTMPTQRKVNQLKMPEKPKTAYMHYAAYARGLFQTRFPRVTGTELTNAVTRGWIEMIPEGCVYWGNIAAADGIRYQNEFARYCETLQEARREGTAAAASISAANASKENEDEDPNATEEVALIDQGQDDVVAAPQQMHSAQNAVSRKRKSEEHDATTTIAKVKAPKAPKKNKSAYMHYSIYARNYMKSNHPNVTGKDATNAVRDGWNAMEDHHQKYWQDKAAADKIRYEEELASYSNQITTEQADIDEDLYVV